MVGQGLFEVATGWNCMRAFTVLAGLLGAALSPSSALAWGDTGHRVICQIAYEELKPEIKARVDALVAIDPKFRTFADACTQRQITRTSGHPSIM